MDYILHVLADRCTGCMECVEACPVEGGVRIVPLSDGWDVVVCRHCNPAPCVDVCDFGALSVDGNGAVTLSERLCTSCKACAAVCPFGAVFLNPDGTMGKCDLCSGNPACVSACGEGALVYERTGERFLPRARNPVRELVRFRGL